MQTLRSGTYAIFFCWIALYTDAFGHDHFTRFRLRTSKEL